jgi:hypothetical protein
MGKTFHPEGMRKSVTILKEAVTKAIQRYNNIIYSKTVLNVKNLYI